ncbi:hypothetical protein Cst_c09340 [Thermoclostridium stercorarium subsp. stercorarium DSM 8532]|uniref:Uncharacterized protein n=1 Tax=Thermoclostridium stercorarium (strain ATCC 35414 / DSM 8532 / NCIMB 11754) TaxID=1121335 RepID=L7VMF4_THES1|nr:hypothetical protein Cst_c09340 [Thermoclostridium stercorarium subsp. stercorarium DSM 8532]
MQEQVLYNEFLRTGEKFANNKLKFRSILVIIYIKKKITG